jgi:hypothetical protein
VCDEIKPVPTVPLWPAAPERKRGERDRGSSVAPNHSSGVHLCPGCQALTAGPWDEQRYVSDGPRPFFCAPCAASARRSRQGGTAATPNPSQELLEALERARVSPFNLTSLARPYVRALRAAPDGAELRDKSSPSARRTRCGG